MSPRLRKQAIRQRSPEPSEVQTSDYSAEGYHSRYYRDSYDVDPKEYDDVIPFSVPEWAYEDDGIDPIDLAAAGLPRRKKGDGRPYNPVPPTYGYFRAHLHRIFFQEYQTPVVVGGVTLAAILVAILLSMTSQAETFEPVAASAATKSAAVETPVATESVPDDSLAEVPEPTVRAEAADDVAPNDCPEGHQPDTVWDRPSGETGDVKEPEPKSDRDRASDIKCTYEWSGSYGFVMTVKGDGESLSKAQYTSYQVSFIVNDEWPNNVYYDDTGFSVHVSWQQLAQDYAFQVFDSEFAVIKGASVDIEWLDESMLQVIVDLPGDEIEVTEVRTELDVYISDANDNYVYDHRDVAIWTAES